MLRKLNQSFLRFESTIVNIFSSFNQHGMYSPALAGLNSEIGRNQTDSPSLREIIGDIFLMGAPKSKVSHARKTRKHLRYIPDPKEWIRCERCGEPKLPHRICRDNANVCAMREEDWNVYKAKKLAEKAAAGNQ